jgi:hypothetical protein
MDFILAPIITYGQVMLLSFFVLLHQLSAQYLANCGLGQFISELDLLGNLIPSQILLAPFNHFIGG